MNTTRWYEGFVTDARDRTYLITYKSGRDAVAISYVPQDQDERDILDTAMGPPMQVIGFQLDGGKLRNLTLKK